jgi:hypothetical protein
MEGSKETRKGKKDKGVKEGRKEVSKLGKKEENGG